MGLVVRRHCSQKEKMTGDYDSEVHTHIWHPPTIGALENKAWDSTSVVRGLKWHRTWCNFRYGWPTQWGRPDLHYRRADEVSTWLYDQWVNARGSITGVDAYSYKVVLVFIFESSVSWDVASQDLVQDLFDPIHRGDCCPAHHLNDWHGRAPD